MNRVTPYHKIIRSAALLVAVLLLYDGLLRAPTTPLFTEEAGRNMANAIGMFASVEENELNTLSADLRARSEELERKEREINSRQFGESGETSMTIYILAGIQTLLLILICTNYVLDWRRTRFFTHASTT